MNYIKTVFGTIYRPYGTFKELENSKETYRYGWITTSGFALLYSITALILSLKGWSPFVPVSLPIKPENYYFYQTFFTLPVGVAGVLASAFISLGILRIFRVKSSFKTLWGPISLASCLPSLITMWIPETLISFLIPANSWNHMTFDLIRIFTGSVWTILLTIIAVKSLGKTKWWQAFITGITASGVMGLLMAICYR